MAEWVILQTPAALLLYLAAVLLAVWERKTQSTKGRLLYVSAALGLVGTGVLLLHGGSLWEGVALLLPLVLLLTEGIA